MGMDLTQAQSFRDYVESRNYELFKKLFFGRKIQDIATLHVGVKGKKPITELQLPDEMAKRWTKTFEDTTTTFVPTVLETHLAKVDHRVYPQDLQESYLGELLKQGQDASDYPIQAFVTNAFLEKVNQEIEIALMQAVEAGAPADADKLKALFNGFYKILDDEVTATNLTSYSPAVDEKMYTTLENMITNSLDPQVQVADDLVALLPPTDYTQYITDYRADFGFGMTNRPESPLTLDAYPNCTIQRVPGAGAGNGIIITRRSNLHYAVDDPSDMSMINFEQEDRSLKMWIDFRLGCQIIFTTDASKQIAYSQ